jgi:acylphosphatase
MEPRRNVSTLHVLVRGQVQGVGFRWFVREAARELNLAGWVRNRRDGSVEVAAEGEPAVLANFRQSLAEGPPRARVTSVDDVGTDSDDTPTNAALERPFTIIK